MTEPPPLAAMCRAARWVPTMTPNRLTCITRAKSDRSLSSSRANELPIPALLNMTWSPPNRSTAVSTSAWTSSASETSARTNAAAGPRSSATCTPASTSTSPITTRAPSATKSSAVARPIPLAPPVTTATLPASSAVTPRSLREPEGVGEQRRHRLRGVVEVGLELALGQPHLGEPLDHRPEGRGRDVRVDRRVGEPEALQAPDGTGDLLAVAGVAGAAHGEHVLVVAHDLLDHSHDARLVAVALEVAADRRQDARTRRHAGAGRQDHALHGFAQPVVELLGDLAEHLL